MSGETILTGDGGGAPAGGAPGGASDPGAAAAVVAAAMEQRANTENSWRMRLPEDLREDPNIVKFTSEEALARSYINASKLMGRERLILPTTDDDEEGWNKAYDAWGRPKTPDEYEFKRPDQLPKGIEYDETLEKNFRTWAHANGYNKKQAAAAYEKFVAYQIERHAQWEKSREEDKARVIREMHREGNYEATVSNAKGVMTGYADPDFRAFLDESGLGNDPRMIRFLAKIGKDMGGERRLSGGGKENNSPVQPQDYQKAINEYRAKFGSSPTSPLMDKSHPEHDYHVREFNKLFQMAYPDRQ